MLSTFNEGDVRLKTLVTLGFGQLLGVLRFFRPAAEGCEIHLGMYTTRGPQVLVLVSFSRVPL